MSNQPPLGLCNTFFASRGFASQGPCGGKRPLARQAPEGGKNIGAISGNMVRSRRRRPCRNTVSRDSFRMTQRLAPRDRESGGCDARLAQHDHATADIDDQPPFPHILIIQICNKDMQYIYALKIWNTYMQYRFAIQICNIEPSMSNQPPLGLSNQAPRRP